MENKKIMFWGMVVGFFLLFGVMFWLTQHNSKEVVNENVTVKSIKVPTSNGVVEKTYNPTTRKINLKKDISKEQIAEISLKTPLNNVVGLGYQRVAEMEFLAYEDFKTYINNVALYDLKDNSKSISRQLDFKYKTTKMFDVPDYVCANVLEKNGTITEKCNQSGTHRVSKEIWEDLNDYAFKSGEPVTIGIYTDVKKDERVEWVPTYYGVEIKEWAAWTSDLKVDIYAYYKLDEQIANGVIIDETGNGHNGTGLSLTNTTGFINTSYNFSSSSINFANANSLTSDTITWGGWISRGTAGGTYRDVMGKNQSYDMRLTNDAGTKIQCRIGSDQAVSSGTLGDSNFHLVVCTYNGTTIGTYIDGVNQANASSVSGTPVNANNFTIGQLLTVSTFIGKEDEIFVLNRTMTATDIQEVFNGGAGLNYTEINAPNVTLNSPAAAYNSTIANIVFNATVTDDNEVSAVTFFLDGVVNETNTSLVNGTYIFNKTLSLGTHNWSIGAINSFNQPTNSSTRTLEVGWILKVGETYTSSILEGAISNFTANFTTNGTTLTLGNLTYNNEGNTVSINSLNSSFYILTKNLTAPTVSADTNYTFYWNITLSSGYYKNFTTNNQTVLNLDIDDCSSYSDVLYNFTIVDEATQSKINTSTTNASIELQVYNFDRTNNIGNYSNLFNSTNPFQVCFSNDLSSGENYLIDALTEYSATNYEIEFYNIQNSSLTSASFPTNITLYDLNSTDSQIFTLKIKDAAFLPLENVLVEVWRKYVSEGTFKIVEIPKTDASGQAVAHLVVNDVIYNFVIKKSGTVIATFSNVRAVCQTPAISNCEIDFNAFSSGVSVPNYQSDADFNFTLGYNSTSRVISSVYVIPSGSVGTVSLNVSTEDSLGTSVCNDIITSSAGTLSCTVPSSFGNSTVTARVYQDNSLKAIGQVKLDQNPTDIYGGVLIGLGFFIMISLAGAALSSNPIFTILAFMVGIIALFSLNLIANNGFVGATATILWLIVAIIIVLVKGGRRS